jgi:hypothetical protein
MEMIIFDIRYGELQEHGTLPNCFRFSLKDKLTEKDVDKFIKDFDCIKEEAKTICILGASCLTSNPDELNGVELYHVKAVKKIISKMEKNNFMHVTTAEEGFEKCHELCIDYSLRIQEHSPEDCYYCIKTEEIKSKGNSEGTFKKFAGKFSSLYERMGQKFKDLLYKKNQEFVVENENDDENVFDSTYPEFDPSKLDNESTNTQDMFEQNNGRSNSKCVTLKFS